MEAGKRSSQLGDDGYFCISDTHGVLIQGEAERDRDPEIHVMGDSPVVVDKMFGPLIFVDVRVTAAIDTCEWVIERRMKDGGWEEVARFEGQPDEYFEDGNDDGN